MTQLTTFGWRVDSTSLNTLANSVAEWTGQDRISDVRAKELVVAFQPGSVANWDGYHGPAYTLLSIWIAGTDADGAVTLPGGEQEHLRVNWEALQRIFAKRGSPITLERDVPDGAGGVRTLTTEAQVIREVNLGGTRGLRTFSVELFRPYPYWHDAAAPATVTQLGNGTFNITTGGTVDIWDPVITFIGGTDAKLAVDGTVHSIQIDGTPGQNVIVDLGAKTVQLADTTDYIANLTRTSADFLRFPHSSTVALTLTGGGNVDVDWFNGYAA